MSRGISWQKWKEMECTVGASGKGLIYDWLLYKKGICFQRSPINNNKSNRVSASLQKQRLGRWLIVIFQNQTELLKMGFLFVSLQNAINFLFHHDFTPNDRKYREYDVNPISVRQLEEGLTLLYSWKAQVGVLIQTISYLRICHQRTRSSRVNFWWNWYCTTEEIDCLHLSLVMTFATKQQRKNCKSGNIGNKQYEGAMIFSTHIMMRYTD